jgi:hypothetical protein
MLTVAPVRGHDFGNNGFVHQSRCLGNNIDILWVTAKYFQLFVCIPKMLLNEFPCVFFDVHLIPPGFGMVLLISPPVALKTPRTLRINALIETPLRSQRL